jgi:hypothetical protein
MFEEADTIVLRKINKSSQLTVSMRVPSWNTFITSS